ncbi:MAG: GGDEF domain-containing protein [Burkholderiaceae bacterium]|nr:GGDEF domain-containing protein [Burkholderiaceae bacterium]
MSAPVLDALPAAAATAAVAAASLTGFGLRHGAQRGWRWWLAAVWLGALGTAAATAEPLSLLRFIAEALLLQWPLTLLIGLRRFHARDALPGHARFDFAVLMAATLALGAALAAAPAHAPWLGAALGSLALLYAATLALRAPAGHEMPALHVLAGTQCLLAGVPLLVVAFAPVDALGDTGFATDPLALRAVAAALGLTVTAFVLLAMLGQRTEQQLRESRQRLRRLANLDALTQLPNRRHFHDLAVSALRHDPPGSAVMLMFDVDHFKRINDNFGHAAGDRALTLVAGSLLEQLRADDVPGRLGGDEFALLLRGAGVPVAIGVAERIVQAMQRRTAEQRLPRLTLSFGVVQLLGREQVDEALRRADQALFEAKRQGRGCAVTAEGDEAHPVFGESQRLGLAAA